MPFQDDEAILDGKYSSLKLLEADGMARAWRSREPGFLDRLVAIQEPRRDALSAAELAEVEGRFQALGSLPQGFSGCSVHATPPRFDEAASADCCLPWSFSN